MADAEYDLSGNPNFSFYVAPDISNLLFLHDFFPCIVHAKI